MSARRKVVILGGGTAALTAAFELTSRDDWREQFSEIVLYQMGWRLGGKAAGGRNQQLASRIEALGPHVLFGSDDNTFRMVQRCYAELDRSSGQPLSRWQDAFLPHDAVTMYEEKDGQSMPWTLSAPRNDSVPGSPVPQTSPWEFVTRCTKLVGALWEELSADPGRKLPEDKRSQKEWTGQWVRHAGEFTRHLDAAVRKTGQPLPLMKATRDILDQTHQTVTEYVKALIGADDRERRLWTQLDVALTCMRGALRDQVPLKGFDVLDTLDLREWLQRHGASPLTLKSPLLAALYDFAFAYVNGRREQPALSAGAGLRLLCRATFDYKGAAFWTAPVGMADALFAPLYEVLRRRGVRFHFFHRVEHLRLSTDRSRVEEIHLDRQATCEGEYEPLIDVNGLPCWPGTPRYEFLKEGAELEKRRIDLESPWSDWGPVERVQLQAGRDYDAIVLGLSLGALQDCCSELIAAAPQWREALQHGRTVATAVSRLWFSRTLKELGWGGATPILAAFKPPLDSCVDVTPALGGEAWQLPDQPRTVAALRGVLSDIENVPPPGANDYPERQQQRAEESALDWLTAESARLWPGLATGPQMNWDDLVDPQNQQRQARFQAQYHRANINPSDRYVQSVPGSSVFRLSPSQPWFQDLFVCGDWTFTGLNVGCMEAAAKSGLQAAAALRGEQAPPELLRDW